MTIINIEHMSDYPNKLGFIIYKGLEEILGQEGMKLVLKLAALPHWADHLPTQNLDNRYIFKHLSQIQVSLEQLYGTCSGRGLALRSGRASFNHGLREFSAMQSLRELEFRLLPLHEKLRTGFELLAQTLNTFSDQIVHISDETDHFLWRIEGCPVCRGRKAESPACQLTVGLLQEALFWLSGGKFYNVEETECIAMGATACTFRIDKQPID